MFEKITIDKIRHDSGNVSFENTNTYLLCYPEFVNYFQYIESLTRHNLVIGINFVYGWMPTAFDFRSTKFEESLAILNSVKIDIVISVDELQVLRGLFNNSLIGTSKLLHFINPELYPIWDGRVYRYLTNKTASDKKITDPSLYLAYQKKCIEITGDSRYEEIHKSMLTKVGYDITKTRSVELIMFYNGKKAINLTTTNL